MSQNCQSRPLVVLDKQPVAQQALSTLPSSHHQARSIQDRALQVLPQHYEVRNKRPYYELDRQHQDSMMNSAIIRNQEQKITTNAAPHGAANLRGGTKLIKLGLPAGQAELDNRYPTLVHGPSTSSSFAQPQASISPAFTTRSTINDPHDSSNSYDRLTIHQHLPREEYTQRSNREAILNQYNPNMLLTTSLPTFAEPNATNAASLSQQHLIKFASTYSPHQQGLTNSNRIQYHQQLTACRPGNLIQPKDHLTFIKIEGFKVASFPIDGELYLCLPQLLQYLKLHFSLQKIIEEFEQSSVNFIKASEGQLRRLIEYRILPGYSHTCPLVKRSEADRICLSLYEKILNLQKKNLVLISSELDQHNPKRIKTTPPSIKARCLANKAGSNESSSLHNDLVSKVACSRNEKLSTKGEDQVDESSKPVLSIIDGFTAASVIVRNVPSKTHNNCWTSISQARELDNIMRPGAESISKTTTHMLKAANQEHPEDHSNLFESEVNRNILNMARAVSSTLMIRVYHRCFGKCVGLYYPSLLKHEGSECIECQTCHYMLSPRRFIGHVHGSRENHVHHWGFNSYNWRYYMHLSRKQTMNSLDDDELLTQFQLLKSIESSPDQQLKEKNVSGLDPTEDQFEVHLDDSEKQSASAYHVLHNNESTSEKKLVCTSTPAYGDHNERAVLDGNKPSSPVSPLALTTRFKEVDENECTGVLDRSEPRFEREIKNHSDKSQGISNFSILSDISHDYCERKLQNWPPSWNPQPFGTNLPSSSLARTSDQLPMKDLKLEREAFICAQLSTYLAGRGIDRSLNYDIVQVTLGIIRQCFCLIN